MHRKERRFLCAGFGTEFEDLKGGHWKQRRLRADPVALHCVDPVALNCVGPVALHCVDPVALHCVDPVALH
jgi:hypothetical protein